MAKKFLDYSGLERLLSKIKSWSNGAFAVKSVNGVDLHSMVVDKTNGTTFGSMTGKTIQQLRDAIDMWHAENAGKENVSLKFSANNNFIGLWNENNLEQTLSSGTTWTLTATNNITTAYSTFQLSTYGDGHELYTIKKTNGVWQPIEKVAKNKSINKSASNKGVKVALGGTVESPTVSVTTTTNGVTANNTGVVSGAEVKSYVDTNAASTATFKAATSTSIAVNGLVPAPSSANATKFLRGDGTWVTPTGSTYGLATSTSNGLMSSEMAAMIYPNLWSGAKGFGDNKHENSIYIYGKGSTFYFVSSQKNSEGNAIVYTMITDGNIGTQKAGSAGVADKLGTSDVGNGTKPIYLSKGSAKSCTYELNKSVPSDAVFTDTHHTAKNIVSNSANATKNVAATNGNVHINLVENNTCRSGIKIVGSGATTVSSDANGNITILSSDTNTTYVAMKGATSSSAGTMGLVPCPVAGQESSYLKGDGTWDNKINEFGYTGTIFIGTSSSNATGWFRIARARGVRSVPSVFRVALYRNYSHAVPEAYVFDVCTSYHQYDPISITQVSGQASTVDGNKLIDKIRVTRDTSTSNSIMYFDFHVNLSKTQNQFYWYVIGNAFSYTSDEVVHNPTITSTTQTYEFTTVNGFKTNGDIEGDSRFRSKMRSNPQTSSGVMFDTAPMLINGFIPYTNTEITESPSGEPPLFGISYLNTLYGNYTSDEIFCLTPGEKIKVECWLRRDVGADTYVDANGVTQTRTKGTFYLGMSFKDKKGHYVNSNAGTVYFNGMVAYQCPCDGVWHHLEAEYTIPKEHTPYIIRDKETNEIISQSDGGGYYTGTIRSMINYPVSGVNGTTPTYMAGLRITKVAPSASYTNKGIQIKLDGSPYIPTPTIVVTTSGVSANNTGVVSGAEVKTYVDANKGVSTVFKAQTSSSNAVNGLVPAPSSANTSKYLRGDGTWKDGSDIINSLTIGTSPAQREDYVVAQYAGGGVSTTTYHRRSLKNIFSSLNDEDIKNALPGVMIWGGLLNTAAYATAYSVGTVLKVNTEESIYILKGSSLVSTSVALGTNLIVSHETYTSGTANTSGNVFLEF